MQQNHNDKLAVSRGDSLAKHYVVTIAQTAQTVQVSFRSSQLYASNCTSKVSSRDVSNLNPNVVEIQQL